MANRLALTAIMSMLVLGQVGCGSSEEAVPAPANSVAAESGSSDGAAPAADSGSPGAAASAAEGGSPEEVVPTPETIVAGATGFALELVADGFATPVLATAPAGNTAQLFIVDQVGIVTAVPVPGADNATPARFTFLDVGAGGLDLIVALPADTGFDERGLLGLAFHPDYRTNGLLYTYTSEPLGPVPDFTTMSPGDELDPESSLSVVREWMVPNPTDLAAVVDPESSRILLTIEQPQKNHNGGALVFGPDAMLYIALGDGGKRDDQGPGHAAGGNAQDLSETNLLGKILRIDPLGTNSRTGEYGIPVDNPFVDGAEADEIFAYGFRNPFRMSFDRLTGELYVGDVGQADIEEVDLVVSGGNYGWPVKEGTFLFDDNGPNGRGFAAANSPGAPPSMIDPIGQYNHEVGISITGGYVYRGERLPGLAGNYVFGDFTSGDGAMGLLLVLRDGVVSEIEPVNHDDTRMYITGFGEDGNGELYVMGLLKAETAGTTGRILQLVPAG